MQGKVASDYWCIYAGGYIWLAKFVASPRIINPCCTAIKNEIERRNLNSNLCIAH
jgi:hypothetical protein